MAPRQHPSAKRKTHVRRGYIIITRRGITSAQHAEDFFELPDTTTQEFAQ